jgi:hypothetical protein
MTRLGSPTGSAPMSRAQRISPAGRQAPVGTVAVVSHEYERNVARHALRTARSKQVKEFGKSAKQVRHPSRPRDLIIPRPISPRTLPAEGFHLRAGREERPGPALLGRSPHNPWRAVRGALALAPSRALLPGRRGSQTCRGAHPSFARALKHLARGRAMTCDRTPNPTDCWPISDRSHNRSTTKETR